MVCSHYILCFVGWYNPSNWLSIYNFQFLLLLLSIIASNIVRSWSFCCQKTKQIFIHNPSCGLLISWELDRQWVPPHSQCPSLHSCGLAYYFPLFSDFQNHSHCFVTPDYRASIYHKSWLKCPDLNFIKTNNETDLGWHNTMIYLCRGTEFQISVNCILIQDYTYILEGLSITIWQSFAAHALFSGKYILH